MSLLPGQLASFQPLEAMAALSPAFDMPPTAASPGTIETFAGDGRSGNSGDNGPATAAQIDLVYSLATDTRGNVFLCESWMISNGQVRKIGPDGTITSVGLYPIQPRGLAADTTGNLLIVDYENSSVWRVGTDGTVQPVAGTGKPGYSGDGGPATDAELRFPRAMCVNAAGNIFIADTWNYRVRKITPDGKISTVAGNGKNGNSGDGVPAVEAEIGPPWGVAADDGDTVYIADPYHQCIRKITAEGLISTVAGSGSQGDEGDGGPAASARFRYPRGLALDSNGNLYVADQFNHRVRKISRDGFISTVAGTGERGYSGDGGPAASAQLNGPYAVAAGVLGELYIADVRNHRVRRLAPASSVARPAIARGGLVSAAFTPAPVGIGSLISVFGSGFASRTYAAGSTPLPRSLGGASLLVNDQPIPLIYVSPNQINAQLSNYTPVGIAKIRAVCGGVESNIEEVEVALFAPAIFTWGSNRGAIVNQDNSLNTAQNAAPRGSVVTIYGTGPGPVAGVGDAYAAPADPPATTALQPSLVIGGREARVLFSGLAPGFVGLWQINAAVPPDAPTGADIPLQITIGRRSSNTVAIAVR
jgi:uncharacterized protein (TIGR03437 family)